MQAIEEKQKTEFVTKMGLEQIRKHNEKVVNFYKKNDLKKSQIQEKIEKLETKISELQTKDWKNDQARLDHKQCNISLEPSRDDLPGEKDFFEKVTGIAYAVNIDKEYYGKLVYLVDGKYFEVGVRIPIAEDGGPDDKKMYFKVEAIQ